MTRLSTKRQSTLNRKYYCLKKYRVAHFIDREKLRNKINKQKTKKERVSVELSPLNDLSACTGADSHLKVIHTLAGCLNEPLSRGEHGSLVSIEKKCNAQLYHSSGGHTDS